MPVTDAPVISLRRYVVTCDRCGRSKTVEENTTGPEVDPIATLGWASVQHPDAVVDGLVVGLQSLVFDTRSCMSAWFARYVRVFYGGPEELPKRRRSTRKAKAKTPAPVE